MSEDNQDRLKDLGEFGLIDALAKTVKIKNSSTLKGIGDDCAVINGSTKKTLITTDMLTEGVHFNLMYSPLKHLGYKAVAVNLSDIYAMNGDARQITVSIAVSSKFSFEAIMQLYEGINLACDRYGVDLVGGDTTTSLTGLTISVTAIGEASEEHIAYRSGAKPTDLICVSGDLGGAYMGLQLLERENEVFKVDNNTQPQLDGYEYILERQLKPEPRRDIVVLLRNKGVVPSSMIDISDGLSSELLHICKESNVGCRVYEEKLPYHPQTKDIAMEMELNPIVAALNGGEDYELLFTVPIAMYDKIKTDPDITVIGHVVEADAGASLVTAGSAVEIPLQAQGWNPISER